MIKRRFYKLDHGDRDAPAESSSSSSDSELEAEATEESSGEEADEEEVEEEDEGKENNNEDVVNIRDNSLPFSSSSGYESEDSSGNVVNLDSSGLPTSDDDAGTQNDRQSGLKINASAESEKVINMPHNDVPEDGDFLSDAAVCVVKCKSVFKCRLCPRIVCLTEETLRTHLKSKRHARSEKLLREGRLKLMLNDDGKIEGETFPEKPVEQNSGECMNKNKRLHRHTKRLQKNKGKHLSLDDAKQPNFAKKRRR